MSDASADTGSAQNTSLGGLISSAPAGPDYQPDVKAAREGMARVQKSVEALPSQLAESKQREQAQEIPLAEQLAKLTTEEISQLKLKPPQPKTTTLAEQWGSPAMLLAVLGSAFTRMPLTNALNAGARVMQAYQQRDFDGAQTATKEWKEANDAALKMYDIESGAIGKAIDRISHGTAEERKEALDLVRVQASAFGDMPMKMLAEQGRADNVVALKQLRDAQIDKLKLSASDLNTANDLTQKRREAAATVANAKTPEDKQTATEAFKKADSDLTNFINSQRAKKGEAPLSEGGTAKAEKFGTIDDLMNRWHQDFAKPVEEGGKGREPTTEEIAAERQALQGQIKPTGGRTQQMTQRLMIGANEVEKAVTALSQMPAGTTLGIFGGAQAAQSEDLGENVKKSLANAITPQSAQILKALSNGVSRGLAILESGGSAQGLVGLSKQLQNDLPLENDTGLTIAAKYADIRQIVEAATEVLATSELSNDQKVLIKNIEKSVQKAVPYTTLDVAKLASNPSDETLAQFAHRIGLGGPKKGDIEEGHRFKGGNPGDPANWEKVQ